MSEKIQELKTKFSEALDSAKEKANEVQSNVKTSGESLSAKVSSKVDEVKAAFSSAQEKAKTKKEELDAKIEAFKHDRSVERAQKKAQEAEEYAMACVELVFASINEAEIAIANALVAAKEAEEIQ